MISSKKAREKNERAPSGRSSDVHDMLKEPRRLIRACPAGKVGRLLRSSGAILLLLVQLLLTACGQEPNTRARELLKTGQFQAAVDFLQAELKKTPSDIELVQLYGLALLRNRQPSLAVWPLRRAFRETGAEGTALIPLVEALARGGAPSEAAELATQGLEEDPSNPVLLRLRAGAHAGNLNHDAALADLDRLLEATPDLLPLQETRANILLKLGRLEEASEVMELISAKVKTDQSLPPGLKARACANAALYQHKLGETEAAGAAFDACLAESPAAQEVLYPMIEFLEQSNQGDRVLDLLTEQASLKAAKGRLMIQVLLAAQLRASGQVAEATDVLLRTAEYLEAPQGWLELAEHYVSIDDMPRAADAIANAIALQTGGEVGYGLMQGEFEMLQSMGSEDGLFAYADILIQAKRFDEVRRVLPHLSEPVHKLLIEARLNLAEGQPRKALDQYFEAFKLWPSNPGARYMAAVAAMRIGEFDEAAGLYQDSLRSDATMSDAGIVLARMQLLQGSPEGAFNTVNLYLMKNPGDTDALDLIVQSAVAARVSGVLAGVHQAYAAAGKPAQGLAQHAMALEAMRVPKQALELLDAENEIDSPEYFLALAAWARMTTGAGEAQAALERVQRAQASHPESARLEVALGMTLDLDPERGEEAAAAYQRAVMLDPELVEARVLLARWLTSQEDHEGATAEYDRAAELEPDKAEHGFNAAVSILAAGQAEEGETRLQAVLERYPWHGDSAAWLAQFALQRGDTGPETLVLARLAARMSNTLRPNAFETLGLVRYERGEMPEAHSAFQQAIGLQPEPASALYHLGRVLIAMGRNADATRRLEEALSANETFAMADSARALLSELSELEQAEEEPIELNETEEN